MRVEIDAKVICIKVEMMQARLGEEIGTMGQYVNRIIKKGTSIVKKIFVQMLEVIGYDI